MGEDSQGIVALQTTVLCFCSRVRSNPDCFKSYIPVDKLEDEDLMQLYTDVIESYVDKLDQFKSIGTPEFLYDSLRYFGEPSDKDIGNANFILHLPDEIDPRDSNILDSAEVRRRMKVFAEAEGYEYSIKLNDTMIANALVSGTTVKINSSAMVPETEANALMHHELGVHLATTLNGRAQPLRIMSLGSPVNTTTQEGLAILCEYLGDHSVVELDAVFVALCLGKHLHTAAHFS